MKNILVLVLLLTFSYSVIAKDNYPKLAEVKNLAGINKIELNSTFTKSIDKNLEKFNSGNDLSPLSLNNKISENNSTNPKRFNFSIMPYAWFTAVGGTVGYDQNGNKFGFNKSFSDAVKYLKMAAAVVGKFKYDRVSFVYDISYINLKGFGTELDLTNAPDIISSNWTVKQTLYDLFISYLIPGSKKTMVDIYGGGRLFALNNASTLIDTNGAQRMNEYNNSFLDPVIGVNAEYVLDSKGKWVAWTKGDIGGFGVNSQMTWQLNAGAGYMLAPEVPLTLGFKYVGVNHDKNALAWQVNEYGFTLGIGYRY